MPVGTRTMLCSTSMPADAAALSWSEPVNDSQTSLTGSGLSSDERSLNDAGLLRARRGADDEDAPNQCE